MHQIRCLLSLGCALALAPAAGAQDATTTTTPPSPAVGSRVLVTFSKAAGYEPDAGPWVPVMSPRLTGRVVQVTRESLYVQPHPSLSAIAVPQGAVHHVYVSRGRPRGPALASGAARGAILGAGMGYAAAHTLISNTEGRSRQWQTDFAMWTISGIVSGAITGAMHPNERWRRVR